MPAPIMLRRILAIAALSCGGAPIASAQLGILTAPLGQGSIIRSDDQPTAWSVGQTLEEGDRIVTGDDSYAMIFFTSGLGAPDIGFDGTIVVEVYQRSNVQIRRRSGRRAPIDIHVLEGRVRAFFDAGEHKDYILLSTPLGELQVTGSIIYAAHDTDAAVSEFGTFDSDCEARLADGETVQLSRYRKVVAQEGQEPQEVGITVDDEDTWAAMPDLNLAAATSFRDDVRTEYAARSWVGEYITAADRLENVGDDSQANIPGQTAVLSQSAASPAASAIGSTIGRQSRPNPGLRSSGGARTVGTGQSGFIREIIGGAGQSTAAIRSPLTIGRGAGRAPGGSSGAGSGLRVARVSR